MRPFSVFAVLSVLAVLIFAPSPSAADDMEPFLKEMRSPRWPLWQEAQERPGYRALWNGQGNWLATRIMLRSGSDAELGLSEEQNERLAFLRKDNEIGRELLIQKHREGDPELLAADALAKAAVPADDPYFERATEEQKRAFVAANEQYFLLADRYKEEAVAETLTPEQMLKVQTLKLQLLPEMGLALPAMFEPLGLSEDQKEQMAAIKKELEPEFEKMVDEAMALRREYFTLLAADFVAVAKDKPIDSGEAMNRMMMESAMKVMKDDKLMKKFRDHAEKGRKFAGALKSRLMNVLSDEQLDRMQELIDKMPEFAKARLTGMRKAREEREKQDMWMPGPETWRPGDGTPKDFKERRRKGGFPGGGNK